MAKRLAAILCTVAMLLGCIASMACAYADGEQSPAPDAALTSQESPAADGTVPEATADTALQAGGEETTPTSGEKTEEPTESTQLTEEVIEPAPETNQAPSVENTETVSEVPAQPTEAEQPPVTNQESPAAPEEPKVEEPAPEQPKTEEPAPEQPKEEEPKAEEPKTPDTEAKSDETVSPEQQINPNPDQQQDQKQPEAQPGTTPEGETPKDPASPEGTVPADVEQPEGNTPADGTNPEGTDPTTDGEDGDEDSDNEDGDTEDAVLPAELKVGESFSGTILAGEPFEITLKAEKAETIELTLTAQSGDQVKVTVDGRELSFAAVEETPDNWTAEYAIESAGEYAISLESVEEREFTLHAAAAARETTSTENNGEDEPAEEEESADSQEQEAVPAETPDDVIVPENEDTNEDTEESKTEEKTVLPSKEGEEPERSAHFEIYFDVDEPGVGDTAHFKATLEGFEGLEYRLTWQTSMDDVNWTDTDFHEMEMDIMVTEENRDMFWRVKVEIENDQEDYDV